MFQQSINAVSLEEHGETQIRQNTDLETRPHIRSKEQLKCMHPKYFNGIGHSKILNSTLNYILNLSHEYKLHIR